MTQQKHFKKLVRQRMKETGERYTAARRAVLGGLPRAHGPHRPGGIPGATAFRVLAAHRGIELTESAAFGVAGGAGIGVFSFFYEKDDFASFFLAGRHYWHDDRAYLENACRRIGLTPQVKESGSPKAAEKALRDMLGQYGPCVAWVDMAGLPHRGINEEVMGGAYHVITVYSIDDSAGTALIGDLGDEPVTISLADLSAARGRIKKDKNRVLAVTDEVQTVDRKVVLREAVQVCAGGLDGDNGVANARRNFSLAALETWADRLTSAKDKERWEHVFAPGHRLFAGLTGIHRYIEHYGTGGGACRPMMAEFLNESAREYKQAELKPISEAYARLGEQWSALADSALPSDVPPLAAVRELMVRTAELYHSGAPATELQECGREMKERADGVRKSFPMTDAAVADLRIRLAEQVRAIHSAELAAQRLLVEYAGA